MCWTCSAPSSPQGQCQHTGDGLMTHSCWGLEPWLWSPATTGMRWAEMAEIDCFTVDLSPSGVCTSHHKRQNIRGICFSWHKMQTTPQALLTRRRGSSLVNSCPNISMVKYVWSLVFSVKTLTVFLLLAEKELPEQTGLSRSESSKSSGLDWQSQKSQLKDLANRSSCTVLGARELL